MLVKAVMRGAFSLIIFGIAQVLIDTQPLVALSTGRGAVHGWSHTWIGAVGIGGVAAIVGRPLANAALRLARGPRRGAVRVSWTVAFGSALIGTLSHVGLDSLLYSDMHPLAPWSDAQPGLGSITAGQAYVGCLVTGALGAVLYVAFSWWRDRRDGRDRHDGRAPTPLARD
jgi:hypothetical protein